MLLRLHSRKNINNTTFLSPSSLLLAHWNVISFASTVFPIPGAPSIRIIQGFMISPSLAIKGTKMSDIFLVALEYKFGFGVRIVLPPKDKPS